MTTINRGRRAFLRQVPGPTALDHRIPWATTCFYDACRRCDDCIAACEPAILVRGDGGFPTVDFTRGGCTFCAACADACRHAALDRGVAPAWSLGAVLADGCLSVRGTTCRACGDACEPGAISFRLATGGRATPVIDVARCTGCGHCVAVCPTDAIRIQEAA